MNLKDDFLDHIYDYSNDEVLCLYIEYDNHIIQSYNDGVKEFYLTTGWTKDEWDKLLSDIDFEYDEYGKQISGYIWYPDGTWSSRSEDDLEWVYNIYPEIPEKLNRLDKVRQKKLNNLISDS
jgi:hypothetical protein